MSEDRFAADASVDADMETMVQLLGRTMRGMKGARPEAD